ncbi:glycosyltransferase [Cryobacterium frigoriphilum]|uniref:glycosyltransferase n=1 Tax=Cryobacterium frigoriphilum TaxID=1259150 RepID=UPI00141BD5B4|nr:glycosyltransferase [Cryobacterium frigoriphilum]
MLIFGHYDLLHVHWPEVFIRAKSRPRRAVKYFLFMLLLLRIKGSRIPVVRTLHNMTPHESFDAGFGRRLLSMLDSLTSVWISLNPIVPDAIKANSTIILHGHYRDWFSSGIVPTEPGRILFFGLVRPYKGVEELIQAFRAAERSLYSLRIVGRAESSQAAESVGKLVLETPRVTARLEYISDSELAEEVGQAELVVLPYRRMFNSGSAILALSLNRPILVPRNSVTVALADEVGRSWVHLYDGQLRADHLSDAFAAIASLADGPPPDLSRRDWTKAGIALGGIYRSQWASSLNPTPKEKI